MQPCRFKTLELDWQPSSGTRAGTHFEAHYRGHVLHGTETTASDR